MRLLDHSKLVGKSDEYKEMKKTKKPIWNYWWVLLILLIFVIFSDGQPEDVPASHEEEPPTIEVLSSVDRSERFLAFYDEMYTHINTLEELDEALAEMQKKSPGRLIEYEVFSDLRDSMEEGQLLYFKGFVPDGFSKTEEEHLAYIAQELNNVFQYRKFAYDYYLTYLEKGNIKDASTSREWLKSADHSLNTVKLNLEVFKDSLELTEQDYSEAEDEEIPLSQERTEHLLPYEIIYVKEGLRYDGGVYYFVLIEPVDIKKAEFKDDIKELIREITTDKGNKITIEFYDNKDALTYGYKAIAGSRQDWLDIQKDSQKLYILARHGIASFSGELETGFFLNTLYFFIYNDQVKNSPVEDLAKIIEFNP